MKNFIKELKKFFNKQIQIPVFRFNLLATLILLLLAIFYLSSGLVRNIVLYLYGIRSNITSINYLVIFAPVLIYFIFSLFTFAIIDKTVRRLLIKILAIVGITVVLLILIPFILVFLVGNAALYSDNILKLGQGSWLEYFGAILGAGITVLGAFALMLIQKNIETKDKRRINRLILANDLKHIKNSITEYKKLLNDNQDSVVFHSFCYFSINENWKEIITSLFCSRDLSEDKLKLLYSYFSDLLYLNSKYNELKGLYMKDNGGSNVSKALTKDLKLKVKTLINSKVDDISLYNFNDLIRKLEERI